MMIFRCIMHSSLLIISYFITWALSSEGMVAGNKDSLSGRKFYIYNWGKRYSDVFPAPGAPLHSNADYNHQFGPNGGMGEAVDEGIGLYQTWQYALFKNMFNRLIVSPHRTSDPTEASVFVIPLDFGANCYMDATTAEIRRGGGLLASEVGAMLQQLESDARFWGRRGHDHVLIFGTTVYHLIGVHSEGFLRGVCANCSVLTIETTPGGVVGDRQKNRKWWFAVPYPSSFHWNDHLRRVPWEPYNDPAERSILVFCVGSVKTLTSSSTKLRRVMSQQCDGVNDTSVCLWHHIAHASNGLVNGSTLMTLYTKATFCLCPAGDSYTRKALFDSIISGCIPVISHKASLGMYGWYFTPEEVSAVSVYIPIQDVVKGSVNVIETLRGVDAAVIRRKQEAIAKIAPRVQYSAVPSSILEAALAEETASARPLPLPVAAAGGRKRRRKGAEDANTSSSSTTASATTSANTTSTSPPLSPLDLGHADRKRITWEPPFEDAVDVAIRALLTPSTLEPMLGFGEEEWRQRTRLTSWPEPSPRKIEI